MLRVLYSLLLAATLAFAQYTVEPAGEPPSELAPAVAAELQKTGHKILGPDGKIHCELWFRGKAPSGAATSEEGVTWKTAPHGALVGALRLPGKRLDRRGLTINPGVYTLRFSFHPVDGAHQGIEPQRDFLILSPAAGDQDPAALPNFNQLMDMSRKASGTPHPATLSMWKQEGDFTPGLSQVGESDWVLQAKVGDTAIGVIVAGQNPH